MNVQVVDEAPVIMYKIQKRLAKLRRILVAFFNDSELRDLCFDLGIDYGSLPGGASSDKARELIAYCERHRLIPELVRIGKQQRPDVSWGDTLRLINNAPSTSESSPEQLCLEFRAAFSDSQEIILWKDFILSGNQASPMSNTPKMTVLVQMRA
jgi:hypothetical protein